VGLVKFNIQAGAEHLLSDGLAQGLHTVTVESQTSTPHSHSLTTI